MARQISFVMHPEDEQAFVRELTTTPGWLVAPGLDGPHWRALSDEGSAELAGEIVYLMLAECVDPISAVASDAIQFWRSRRSGDVITEGRLAVVDQQPGSASRPTTGALTTRAFNRLHSRLRRAYTNRLIVWRHDDEAADSSAPQASATTWVGPAAKAWLEERSGRCVKQIVEARVSGWLARAAV